MDAELAFLQSMRDGEAEQAPENAQVSNTAPVDDEDEEDYDPSSLDHSIAPQPTQPRQPSTAPETEVSDVAKATLTETEPNGEATARESRAMSQQPKTIGGFIVDDDDDEEDNAAEAGAKSPRALPSVGLVKGDDASSNTPQASAPEPSHNTLPQDVLESNAAPDQDSSGSSIPNDPTHLAPSADATLTAPSPSAANETPAPAPSPSVTVSVQRPASVAADAAANPPAKSRLPHDRVGMLEDRISEDPRGDVDAWLTLIDEHRKRNKLDDARKVYDRFFKVFPAASEQWVAYLQMELDVNDFWRAEQIFKKTLTSIASVQLWSTYLNYVRRRNDLNQDPSGSARQVVSQTYDFVLQHVGIDKDSGHIWQEYISFLRSGPGQIGGSSWQDQQKMDVLRKTYQKAICIPTQAINLLWKEYDTFEMGLNKATGRKFLQDKSPSYMTARSSNTALQNMTKDLDRSSIPVLPPALGFEGDVEYMKQVEIWKSWIEWEKEDPLVLKDEDLAAFRARVLYAYKQAVMSLRFWPEIWFEAADFCFSNGLDTDGTSFLKQGAEANPESCLLAFKRADRIEATTVSEEGSESIRRRGETVREPYDKVIDALYELINKARKREAQAIATIKEQFAVQRQSTTEQSKTDQRADDNDDDDDDENTRAPKPDDLEQAQIDAVQKGNAVQIKMLSRTVSFAWIALMRAMRRVQGKGKPNETIGGSRQIFTDARKKGKLTSDVYVASALIEYHCYKDPAATKIFERGMKLFPADEQFALEYLKHLIAINDVTNARAVFETTVNRLTQKPETAALAKPIYTFFHHYEACYGELSQLSQLEKRMADLFPEDPKLHIFSQRYAAPGFDPTMIRPIISPAVQARPKGIPSVEITLSAENSPRPSLIQPALAIASPKRPLDDSDSESNARRKLPRAESPLKGAAGRRLDAQKRTQLRNEVTAGSTMAGSSVASSTPLPRGLHFLLSIIPRADLYQATTFNPERLVQVIQNLDLTKADLSGAYGAHAATAAPPPSHPYAFAQPNGGYGYGQR